MFFVLCLYGFPDIAILDRLNPVAGSRSIGAFDARALSRFEHLEPIYRAIEIRLVKDSTRTIPVLHAGPARVDRAGRVSHAPSRNHRFRVAGLWAAKHRLPASYCCLPVSPFSATHHDGEAEHEARERNCGKGKVGFPVERQDMAPHAASPR